MDLWIYVLVFAIGILVGRALERRRAASVAIRRASAALQLPRREEWLARLHAERERIAANEAARVMHNASKRRAA